MAKTIKGPYKFGELEGVPIILTLKTVRRINAKITSKEIDISVPYKMTEREINDAIEEMRPQLIQKLKMVQESRNDRFIPKFDSVLEFKPIAGFKVKGEIRSNLKRLRSIFETDTIIIKIPPNTSLEDLLAFYQYCFDHYSKKLKNSESQNSDDGIAENKTIKEIIYFGKQIKTSYTGEEEKPYLHKNKLIMPVDSKDFPELQKQLINDFLEEKLHEYISKRMEFWQKVTGLTSTGFKIRKMKTRWGSCTTNSGKIRFSFYLILAPKECVDSVIIHEITHLAFGGHQKDFYDFLHKYCPDYDRKDKKLKEISSSDQYLFY